MINYSATSALSGSGSCLYTQSLHFTIQNGDEDGSSSTVSFPVYVYILYGSDEAPLCPLSFLTQPFSRHA